MATHGANEIRIPDWAWRREQTRTALHARDVGALFAVARSFGGASQARIAAVTGLSQPRVNEIVNGRRLVSSIDVLERIADGLAMPDDARMTFGLAPRGSAGRTGTQVSSEISAVHPSQEGVAPTVRRHSATARELDLLAVRGLGIIGMNGSLLRDALMPGTSLRHARILLLDPRCEAARRRADEIRESADSFAAGIDLAVARLSDAVHGQSDCRLEVRLYTRLPIWRMIRLDDVMFVSAFDSAWEGHESVVYEIPRTDRGAFWAGHRRGFDELWSEARCVVGEPA